MGVAQAVQDSSSPCCSASCTTLGKEHQDINGIGMKGFSTPGMALAEALAESAPGPIKDDRHITQVKISAKPQPLNVVLCTPPKSMPNAEKIQSHAARSQKWTLDGLWRDKDHAHLVKQSQLLWSDNQLCDLTLDDESQSISMPFNGIDVTGRLDDTGNVLKWSDGDKWTRITFNGTWDDSGNYHVIRGSQLHWSNGSITSLEVVGWDSLNMMFNENHVKGHLERCGDKISWNDDDVWERAGLDGTWQSREQDRGFVKSQHYIVGDSLMHSCGKQVAISRLSRSEFSMKFEDKHFEAHMDEDGKDLLWSDGDVWMRVQPADNVKVGI